MNGLLPRKLSLLAMFLLLLSFMGASPLRAEISTASDTQAAQSDTLGVLEEVLHVANEIGKYVIDFYHAVIENPLQGIREILQFFGELFGLIDAGDGEGDVQLPGPGLGNVAYDQSQLFSPLGWVDHKNGVPGLYPGRKPYGTNLGMMIDGYFFTLFAPDSGLGPGGFLFLDVSNPAEPALAKRVYDPEGLTSQLREPHAFGLARIDGRRYMSFQNIKGIEIWDFTDLNNLVRVSELALPNVDGGDYSNVSWQLSWQAPYLYVAGSEQGIFIVDTSDPTRPLLVDRGEGKLNPVPPSELGGFRIGPLVTFGNLMVISSMENTDGIASVDISDPVNPRLLDRTSDLPQLYYSTCFNGKDIAVSVRGSGARMVLYDVEDPEDIVMSSDQLVVDGQLYCAFQDQFVFQGAEDRVHKIDISDPNNPVEVGSGTLAGPFARLIDHGQISPLGNLVFIGNDHGTGSAFMPHAMTPDRQPPLVQRTSPSPDAVGQSVTTRVGIAFSDVIDFNSVGDSAIRLLDSNNVPVPGVFSVQNTIVHLAPLSDLQPNTQYRIQVIGNQIRDVAGNALSESFEAVFSTGAGNNHLDVPVTLDAATLEAGETGGESGFGIEAIDGYGELEYQWDFGDGTKTAYSTESAYDHQYDSPGHYQVTLTIRQGEKVTQRSFTKTIIRPLTESAPKKSSTVVSDGRMAFVVNPDNNTLSAIDLETLSVTWETYVGRSPQSVALSQHGQLWVAVEADDKIAIVNTQGEHVDDISLGYGSGPVSLVFTPDKQFALVTLSNANQMKKLDSQGNVVSSLTLPSPRAIAINGAGDTAWVTRFISLPSEGQVYEVDIVSALNLRRTIPLAMDSETVDSQDRARGVPNYLFDIAVSPDGLRMVVPSKKDNILRGEFRDGNQLEHDNTIRSIVSTIDTVAGVTLDDVIDFDNRSGARAVTYSQLGDYIFTAQQGSNHIIVTDAYSGAIRVELVTGLAPQGVTLTSDGRTLLVHNFLSRTLSVFDVTELVESRGFSVPRVAEIHLVETESMTPEELRGKQIFYNAADPRMSRESYLSCASCHVDGAQDGMVWDFHERGEGLRNTISMQGRAGTAHGNVHWTANFDEIQDFEHDIRAGFGGTGFLSDTQFEQTGDPLGLAKAGMNDDLDALTAYAESLVEFGRSPYRNAAGGLSEKAAYGQQIYQSLACVECHQGERYTDGLRHVLPTINEGSGNGMGVPLINVGIETPTLLGLWDGAPFFHDGAAVTLEEVLRLDGHGDAQSLSSEDMEALQHFLLSLDSTPLTLMVANSSPGQTLENLRGGCLSIVDDGERSMAVMDACEHSVRWLLDGDRIRLASDSTRCLEWNGWPLGWSKVYLETCSETKNQRFVHTDTQYVRLGQQGVFVLDAFGGEPGSKVGAWWHNHAAANQQWRLGTTAEQ